MLSTELAGLQALLLYPGVAPGATAIAPEDTPTLQPFFPDPTGDPKPSGAAVIVLPGGGYVTQAGHEGPTIARWLNRHGIAAFVLRYRVAPKYRHPAPLTDAQRAIRLVRYHAPLWRLDPGRIGILGFSAGGHLAATAATHFDGGKPEADDPLERASSRPDLQVLIYPVITLGQLTHGGSRSELLGPEPSAELVALLSNEQQVTAQTPPAFLFHSTADMAVPVANSDLYAAALQARGIPHEYVRGDLGGHGIGLTEAWDGACIRWLRAQGF